MAGGDVDWGSVADWLSLAPVAGALLLAWVQHSRAHRAERAARLERARGEQARIRQHNEIVLEGRRIAAALIGRLIAAQQELGPPAGPGFPVLWTAFQEEMRTAHPSFEGLLRVPATLASPGLASAVSRLALHTELPSEVRRIQPEALKAQLSELLRVLQRAEEDLAALHQTELPAPSW